MKRWLKILTKVQTALLYLLPIVIFFSYHPAIMLGTNDSMNFELSLPLIWLLIFALVNLPTLPSVVKKTQLKRWQIVTLSLFPLYLFLSILWSPNLPRAILTAGIFGCLIISILALPRLVTSQTIKNRLVKVFLTASVLIAVWCWVQSILDVAGFPTTHTLACQGCTTNSFGFPHPNGFAIEPQFMGNLLLAPTLLALYLFFHSNQKRWARTRLLALTIFLATTLFFTFSRGAIYAFCIALAIIVVAELVRPLSKKSTKQRPVILMTIPIMVISLLFSITMQGVFATLSPTTDDFWSGVTKSIHQLSLGKIDLRPAVPADIVVENTTIEPAPETEATQPSTPSASTFDGYVAESTNFRLHLTESSLKTWSSHPQTILIGTGLGGAGIALHQAGYTNHPKEITQNQYTEVLLELGLIGTLLLVVAIITIFSIVHPLLKQSSAYYYLLALVVSYAATLGFFSGLPNALHIYLLPPMVFWLLKSPTKH